MRQQRLRVPLAAGVLSLACYAALQAQGVTVLGDSWAYWQGAVSMAEGHGYRYFSGDPIVAWPPLYSLYLVPWVWFAGATTRGLALANGLLIVSQAVLWTWCLLDGWRRSAAPPSTSAEIAVGLYLALLLPLHQQFVLSELLKYALLAPFLWTAWRAMLAAQTRQRYFWATGSAVLGALMMITHHGSVAFVVAGAILVASQGVRRDRASAIGASALLVVIPACVWMLTRQALDHWGSHAIGWAAANDTPVNYLRQAAYGVGRLLSSNPEGRPHLAWLTSAAVLFAIARGRWPAALTVCSAFVGIASAITVALFCVTAVNDPLDTRFLIFIAVVMVPAVLLAADRWPRWRFVAIAAMVLVPLANAMAWSIQGARHPDDRDPDQFLRYGTRISSQYREGPAIDVAGERLIAPDAWREPDLRQK